MRAIIVYNPKSGKGRFKKRLNYVKDELIKKGIDEITVFESKKSKEITNFIEESLAKEKYDVIISSGGDGTLNETINGLMKIPFENRPKLLYVPTGTVNDVGHMFGLTKSIEDDLKLIDEENVCLWDICKLNDAYFDYVSGCGKFIRASYQTNHPKLKKAFGLIYYFVEAVKELFKNYTYEMKIKTDSEIVEGKYCLMLVCDSQRIGSLYLRNSPLKLDDGIVDMYLFDSKINTRIFNLVNFFFSGGKFKNGVTKISSSKFEIETLHPVRYNIDGERGPKLDKATISVEKQQIKVYVSKKSKEKYFN